MTKNHPKRQMRIMTFHSIRKKIATPKVDDFDVPIIAKMAMTIYTRDTIYSHDQKDPLPTCSTVHTKPPVFDFLDRAMI